LLVIFSSIFSFISWNTQSLPVNDQIFHLIKSGI